MQIPIMRVPIMKNSTEVTIVPLALVSVRPRDANINGPTSHSPLRHDVTLPCDALSLPLPS